MKLDGNYFENNCHFYLKDKMKKLDFNLSASTINSFFTCPWAFKQDKILKIKTTKIPNTILVLAQAFHKIIAEFYEQKKFKTYDLFQNWGKFFDLEVKVQKAEFLDGLAFSKASGFTFLKNWVAMAKENNWLHEAIGAELEFMQPYTNDKFEINFHGFMDLVIEIDGKVYIIDWKTGKHDEEKYKLQAITYSWALYKQFGLMEDKVRFVHPSKKMNTIIDVKVTDEDYYIVKDKVEKMFFAIENDKFDKIVNEKSQCKYCNWLECEHNVNKNLKEFIFLKKQKDEAEDC